MVMVMVDKEGDSVELVLDDEDDIGAYVNAGIDEAVVVDALELWGEDGVGGDTDNKAERVVAVVIDLGEAGTIVAPHVHTDTHVQTDEHLHDNLDACVQDAAVESENNGMAPGGNELTTEKVDD